MCTVDHATPLAHPGYLIDVQMKSIAPDVLFTRMLAHHKEVGLSSEQVLQLLEISREYHTEQGRIRSEFGRLSERLEIKWGRVGDQEVANREELLDEHARLFRASEACFFEYARRGHQVLSDEQIEAAEAIYHAEKDRALTELSASLDSAVAPTFRFRPVAEPGSYASTVASAARA